MYVPYGRLNGWADFKNILHVDYPWVGDGLGKKKILIGPKKILSEKKIFFGPIKFFPPKTIPDLRVVHMQIIFEIGPAV